jgi:transglutaminase-like putative cysteine protease
MRIEHETQVGYDGAVHASYNEVRMTPLTLPGQTTLAAKLDVRPAASVWQYQDYWGTRVTAFDLQESHDTLLVIAVSTVETAPEAPLPAPCAWPDIAAAAGTSRLVEFVAATDRTVVSGELVAAVRELTTGADPHEAAVAVAAWVRDHVEYLPGATGVQTRAQEAWDQGSGVCQDIAHLTVALLRSVGLPARYVSGYLHPSPDAQPGDTAVGESHAWVEYWAGEWSGYDPTNRIRTGPRHVVVGRGRDYGDVLPHKGIYHGAPAGTLTVTVNFTRLA